jgi:Ca-activated chloride channel family protein
VDTTAYAVVRRFLKQGDRPPTDAVRVEELVNYFDYDYPLASASEVFKPFVSVVPSPWSPGKRIVHVALTGHDVPDARPPLNLVFLVDVSGSMEPEDRLPLARKALEVLVDQLRPQDRVAIAVYAGAAGAVLEPTSGAEKSKILRALRRLEAGGSTAGAEGLALAYEMARENFRKDAVNRVILMTDGDFNVGVVDEGSLEDFVSEQRKTGIYLSAYGFGQENYQDRRMQAISQSGNGTAGYIDSLDEARKLFRNDFTGSVFPSPTT